MGPFEAIAAVLALFALLCVAGRNHCDRRNVTCPTRKRPVELLVLQRGCHPGGKALKVKSCSVFADPRRLECGQECLGWL
ncbi:MAG: hypothetical protein HY721_12510 [Planctomycetes bacterium]|nr:hypothetical protein [Planctomycetota bacterium]